MDVSTEKQRKTKQRRHVWTSLQRNNERQNRDAMYGRLYCREYTMAELYQNKYRIPTTRVNWHDYNNGFYFVTICTEERKHYLGDISFNEHTHNGHMHLSPIGIYCSECINQIDKHWEGVQVIAAQVMPNHVHMIINCSKATEQTYKNGVLSLIIGTFKSSVTREARKRDIPFGWQTRFHEHIIRRSDAFNEILNYIQNNVNTWADDCFNK